MARASVSTIEISRVGAIETVHDLQEVAVGKLKNHMIVVVHENIGMDQDSITIVVVFNNGEKLYPVGVIAIYLLFFVSTTSYVVKGTWVL